MSFGQDLDVAVTAAAANSRARILQRPRIQTSHNEPASLFVGDVAALPDLQLLRGRGVWRVFFDSATADRRDAGGDAVDQSRTGWW